MHIFLCITDPWPSK